MLSGGVLEVILDSFPPTEPLRCLQTPGITHPGLQWDGPGPLHLGESRHEAGVSAPTEPALGIPASSQITVLYLQLPLGSEACGY